MCMHTSVSCAHGYVKGFTHYRGLFDKRWFLPCPITSQLALHQSIIFYLVLNVQGQNLITLYCINTQEQKRTFHIMSLILPDNVQADVAWCVGPVCTESYCHTSVWSGLWIWPDFIAELSCWRFCECFMTCVSTALFKKNHVKSVYTLYFCR